MSVKVAYLECTGDLWPEIAEIMRREKGWEPVYWSGALSLSREVERRFPKVIFHDNALAVKGLWPPQISHLVGRPLDETLLAKLSYMKSTALHMMDRTDPDGSYSFGERVQTFENHLRFALALLEMLRPDLVVLACPPHLVYDYVLYEMYRLQGVPLVVFMETAVDSLIFPASGYEDAPRILGDTYRNLLRSGAPAALSARGSAYAERLKGDYSIAVPKYVVDLNNYERSGRSQALAEADVPRRIARFAQRLARGVGSRQAREAQPGCEADAAQLRKKLGGQNGFARLKRMLRETGRYNAEAIEDALELSRYVYEAIETQYPLHLSVGQAEPTYLKQYAVSHEDSQLSYIEYWLYRSLAVRKKRALFEQHQICISPADLSQPFIYVPLQLQPEVSTSPLAGVYVEQYLLVELLSRTAPPGWLIYVKENRFMFGKAGSGELGREFDFYRKLTKLPNVRLIPLNTPPFDLIDNAKAVATATGTSGWEALFRGTPVLNFGYAWYRECYGVLPAADLADCRAAMERVLAGYRPDEAKTHIFLQALETIGFRGYTIPELAETANLTTEQNIQGFVEALRRVEEPNQKETSAGGDFQILTMERQ
jgi:hypothetical protein